MVQTFVALMMPSFFLYVCSVITVITVVFKMCVFVCVSVSRCSSVIYCSSFILSRILRFIFYHRAIQFFYHLTHLHLMGAEMNS